MNFGFQSGGSGATPLTQKFYGSFYDATQQTALGIGTPTAMLLGVTALSAGIFIQNNVSAQPTRIFVKPKGIYNLQFSAQLEKTSGGTAQTVDIWIRVNETDVPDTNTRVTLENNGHLLVAAWNWYVALGGNSYVEIMWAVTDLDIVLQQIPTPYSSTPSVIATIEQVE